MNHLRTIYSLQTKPQKLCIFYGIYYNDSGTRSEHKTFGSLTLFLTGDFSVHRAINAERDVVGLHYFMMTSSNGNICRVTDLLCREFTGHRWIPLTKATDAELCVFFDMRPNKRLNIQSWGWSFETPSRSLWRHRNVISYITQLTASNIPMGSAANLRSSKCRSNS